MLRKRIIVAAVMMLAAMTCVRGAAAQQPGFVNISVEQFLRQIETEPGTQVVDTRTPEKRVGFYLRGSINISVSDLQRRAGELNLGKPIVVFCQTGRTSPTAAQILVSRNAKKVYNLQEGIYGFLRYLSTEPDTVNSQPAKKSSYDKVRDMIISNNPAVGLKFPAYNLTPAEGRRANIAEYAGGPMMLAFFNASDPEQIEKVTVTGAGIAKKFKGMAYVPIAVYSSDAELESLKKRLDAGKWTGEMYYDKARVLADKLVLGDFPSFNLIDSEGVFRVHHMPDPLAPEEAYDSKTLDQLAAMVSQGKLPPYPVSDTDIAEVRQQKLVGAKAPDFTLKDIRGEDFRLHSAAPGRGIILVFGSLWCPYTRKQLEAVNFCGEDQMEIFEVIAVLPGNTKEFKDAAYDYVRSKNIGYSVLLDSSMNSEVFAKYYISSVPVWWVLDADRTVRMRQTGFNEDVCALAMKALK